MNQWIQKLSLIAMIGALCATATACGQAVQKSTTASNAVKPVSASDQAAVKSFILQVNVTIQKVNQGFVAESTLIKKVTTKQISYNSFQSNYKNDESNVSSLIKQLAAAKAPSGAKQYQSDYVSLLNQGTTVFRPSGTSDSSQSNN